MSVKNEGKPDKTLNDVLMSTKEGHVYKIFHARKHFAKKNNIEFKLTFEDVLALATDECPILNIKLSWCQQNKRQTENSPTLDRILPEKGYVLGNVSWISNRANRIKNDGTAEEHLKISQFIDKYHNVK